MITSVNKLDNYTTDNTQKQIKKTLGKDEFLKLLVTQMQFQDPLKPMENTEFTAQLAQFSSLDQLFSINDEIKKMSDKGESLNNVQAVNFIGKEIIALGNNIHKGNNASSPDIGYSLDANVSEVEVNIIDKDGGSVRSIKLGPQDAGVHSVNWDGRDASGSQVTGGDYTFSITARDVKGDTKNIPVNITGTVTGVSFQDNVPYLMVAGTQIAVSDVMYVKEVTK